MTIITHHSGAVEVSPEQVLHFSPALPPFTRSRRYALLSAAGAAPFLWLQSLDEPALALVVAPYEAVCPQEPPPVPEPARRALGLEPSEAPEAYVVVCLDADPKATTVDLLAPLFVCRRTARARQVILDDDLELARVPLFGPATATSTRSPRRETHAGPDATGG
ncbi:MAG: flagellar assembly protein FliW [Armatimonadetes bacterium]|nr:flagellar assembly protein FliW [Armatimonadota bacterium]